MEDLKRSLLLASCKAMLDTLEDANCPIVLEAAKLETLSDGELVELRRILRDTIRTIGAGRG